MPFGSIKSKYSLYKTKYESKYLVLKLTNTCTSKVYNPMKLELNKPVYEKNAPCNFAVFSFILPPIKTSKANISTTSSVLGGWLA